MDALDDPFPPMSGQFLLPWLGLPAAGSIRFYSTLMLSSMAGYTRCHGLTHLKELL